VTTAPPRLATAAWRALGCECRVVVTDPDALPTARALLEGDLAALDQAASRFRPDSELSQLAETGGAPTALSPLLADLLRVALQAAHDTGGAVDPTLGQALLDCGYDADLATLPAGRPTARVHIRPRAHWSDVHLEGSILTLPAGTRLDLGATAKAHAADLAADHLAAATGVGVLVSLGGDVAARGPAPTGDWSVRVQDLPQPLDSDPDGPTQTVSISGGGLATSSVRARRWAYGAAEMHHLLDPWTGLPAATPWRTVTAAAPTCLQANIATTATIVLAERGQDWAVGRGLPMRLVDTGESVTRLGGWPA
jgi:thiamine biosynthesis lipoprotein